MWNKHVFIIGWQIFNILWMCDALVKDLVSHHGDEGFKSLYIQPIHNLGKVRWVGTLTLSSLG
jgi:hypothetical protein